MTSRITTAASVNPVWGRRDIACLGYEPDQAFGGGGKAASKRAQRICAQCPLDARQQCGEWAIETGQEHGVFGGLNPNQRYQERKRRKKLAQAGEKNLTTP